MKRKIIHLLLLYVIFFCANSFHSYAQSNSGGAYAGVDFQVSSVNKGLGLLVGLSGGYRTNNGFIIGAEIYDLLNGTPFPNQTNVTSENERKSKMHIGGIVLGYANKPEDATRFRFTTLIGVGDISAYTTNKGKSQDYSTYFALQPKISVDIYSDNNLNFIGNAGYRFHFGANTPGTDDGSLGGVFAGLTGEYHWGK